MTRKPETLPLDLGELPARVTPERQKRIVPVAWGKCPECIARPREALIQSGSHLVWRPHRYRTWAGTDLDCRASGVALCHLGPRKGTPITNADKTVRSTCRCLALIGPS